MKILIVNSSQSVFDAVKNRLQNASGVEMLLYAANAEDAVKLVVEHKPDVMLVDKNAEGIDENDLIAIARKKGQVKLIRYTDSSQMTAEDLFG